MSDSFYRMQAEVLAVAEPKPEPKSVYLVIAWSKDIGWRVHRDRIDHEHATEEAARKHIAGLASLWRYAHIARIDLPAKETT